MNETDTIKVPGDLPIPGMEPPAEPPMEPVAHPAEPPKKKGGRPPGSKTDPRIREATSARLQGKQPRGAGRPSVTQRTSEELTTQLAAGYEMIGASLVSMSRLSARMLPATMSPTLARAELVGNAIRVNATECAASIVVYSERSPRLRTMLERSGQGASLLGIAVAHLPIIFAVFGDVPRGTSTDADPMADPMRAILDADPADLAAAMRLATEAFGGAFPTDG